MMGLPSCVCSQVGRLEKRNQSGIIVLDSNYEFSLQPPNRWYKEHSIYKKKIILLPNQEVSKCKSRENLTMKPLIQRPWTFMEVLFGCWRTQKNGFYQQTKANLGDWRHQFYQCRFLMCFCNMLTLDYDSTTNKWQIFYLVLHIPKIILLCLVPVGSGT
jgi:hypothetical protein